MNLNSANAPWHKTSYDAFFRERLPELLAENIGLASYSAVVEGGKGWTVRLAVSSDGGLVETTFENLPAIDAEGWLALGDRRLVVLPIASGERLDEARVQCIGEQLGDFVGDRLGRAPGDLKWDAALLRSWVRLDAWIEEFLGHRGQDLDDRNWLARNEHLRRFAIPEAREVFPPGQLFRARPVQTPEGPNCGKILHVALGAEILEGRFEVKDDSPQKALSLTASMIPFLEHDDPNRALVGANMIRQALRQVDPEPAWVQTGNEPDAPDFWCGRNLLTAFVSMGSETFEDGLVISESAASRFGSPAALEPGDKLANRHGQRGVIARILPHDRMPRLADGRAVELVVSFIAVHARLNFGQVREAVMGRIAQAEDAPAIVPPLAAPSAEEIRSRLRAAGLGESGMETLRMGPDESACQLPSTVGWVYWNKLYHRAAPKATWFPGVGSPMRSGEMEFWALRDAGAFETIREAYNLCNANRADAESLPQRLAAGPVEQAEPPGPMFLRLQQRLAGAGIRAAFEAGTVTFGFADCGSGGVDLAEAMAHPWHPAHRISRVGDLSECPSYPQLLEANERLRRMIADEAPPGLRDKARENLQANLEKLLEEALDLREHPFGTGTPQCVRFAAQVTFSGRAVLAPGSRLQPDQVGLPEEMARSLFGPMVSRQVGSRELANRTNRAAEALDRIMARSWVRINRAPTLTPTNQLAFRPVRIPDNVIRLPLMSTALMNADFDGDQVAVFVPMTDAAQTEAGKKLSIAAHLKRDPSLLAWFWPQHEAMWGLAWMGLGKKGRKRITEILGFEVGDGEELITRTLMTAALKKVLDERGPRQTLDVLDALIRLGMDAVVRSGASVNPFCGEDLNLPAPPRDEKADSWARYEEQVRELLACDENYSDSPVGPQLLAVKTGARGNLAQLACLVGPLGRTKIEDDTITMVRRSWSEGLEPGDFFTRTVGARRGLAEWAMTQTQMGIQMRQSNLPKGFGVLARAARSRLPGIVFGHAAATGEVDPLTDLDSRLFVGLRG